MRKFILCFTVFAAVSIFANAQVTADKVTVIFDGKTMGTQSSDWLPDPGGQTTTITVNADYTTTFNVSWVNASYYPMAGILYFNPKDVSKHNKLLIKTKLPSGNTHNFKVEPIMPAAKIVDGTPGAYGWTISLTGRDTVRLNSGNISGSNPEFHAPASDGTYKLLSYKVQHWNSTFPAKNVWMDSTKLIGVNVYYGWDVSAVLAAKFDIAWVVLADSTQADADIATYMTSTLTGISTLTSQIKEFGVYPNPVVNELRFNNNGTLKSVIITNIIGEEVIRLSAIKNGENIVNVLNLSQGAYLIKFIKQGGVSDVNKFIKR